jgi:rhamnosyltransferase
VAPKIAILMAVYNGGLWLKPQLESILSQKGVDVTVYVSDDLSTDQSYSFLVERAAIDERLVVLPHAGKFNSAGANFHRLLRCVDISKFDYIAFSDQDDIWFDTKLMHAVESVQMNASDGYSANVTAFWPNGNEVLIDKAQPQREFDYMFESSGPGCTFVFSNLLAKSFKTFLIKNEALCRKVEMHDWFLYAFSRSRGYKWVIDDVPQLMYRQHDINVMGANIGVGAKISRMKKMLQGWHVKQALLIAQILGYEDKSPIILLQRFKMWDRLRLVVTFFKYRRNFREAVALALYFVIATKQW